MEPLQLHFLFECLAYIIGFRLLLARNLQQDAILPSQRTSVITGGIVGAICGAKFLVLLQHLDLIKESWQTWLLLILAGKTIVGGLLGGLIGVEITKKLIGLQQSTGDVFVYPLIFAMAIGRVGCFFGGLSDRTYGIETTLPWGVDFGDGITRHPTQLYEIIFFLHWRNRYAIKNGDLFKIFMFSYLSFRFLVDFIKPDFHLFLGLSAIQIACLLGIVYYHRTWRALFNFRPKNEQHYLV
jgi:prolipoprotein diacylglyceryltransferase